MASLKRLMCCSLILATEALLCSGSIARDQTPDVKPKPTGSISGRVTLGGSPAEGIPVVAVSGQTVNRRDAAARTVTDSEGRYRLPELLPGQYQIWAVTPGLIAEPGPLPRYGFPYFGSIQNIILGANEDVSDIDIKLVRGAVITGRVTDAENKPVVEERVSLQLVDENGAPSRFGSPMSANDQMYQTDDRGVYRIYSLPGGRYKVSVGYDASDGVIRGGRHQRTFYPDASDQSKAAIVELKEGGETNNIDIKVGSTTQTYAVSGHVIDAETGLPIARAGVRFALVRQDQGPPLPGFMMQTDDRGEFSFDGFAPGHYSAVASSERYEGNFYGDPVNFEVVDRNVSGLELRGIPGLSVSGVIVADGVITKDLLSLLPGLRISARVASGSSSQASTGGSSIVAPDGSFQVNGLRPGRVSIDAYASAPTYTRPAIAHIEHDGIGITQGFDIRQSVSGLRIMINYGTGAIRGTVRLEGGALLADSRIYVNSKREGERDGTGIVVDARGHFVIKNLAPGTYEVTVQVGFGGPAPSRRPVPPQKQLVSVTNGSESEVTFVVDLTPQQGGP
ncbi:MAG TPA: carboxypeptidase regulatory-like domain-containing protein [Pyrinomonadaceae bacterium]|jgi:protocatechuate 3,4-dioxygenase beta subunit|nr:carboxypeptidase regulatory-like domain-containing protein [Pyrinomonadaceae bacterium]